VAVPAGGPADRAGLQVKDLIVLAGGRIVTGVDDLHRLLAGLRVPSAMALSVVRAGRLIELTVEPALSGESPPRTFVGRGQGRSRADWIARSLPALFANR